VCVIIPNLTRDVRPYAFIENVVTHKEYRHCGYATGCLNYAKEIAKSENCYKIMLLTGAKNAETLDFYRKAGYNSTDKTAFIQWIDRNYVEGKSGYANLTYFIFKSDFIHSRSFFILI